MNRHLVAGAVLFACGFAALHAQQYTIGWYKFGGSNGKTSGGQYTVGVFIGEHDASGPLIGGNYLVTGGVGSIIVAIENPALPNISVAFIGPQTVVVSWPNTGSYTLEQNSGLEAAGWETSVYSVSTANGTNSITISPATGNVFFRLKQ